MQWMKMFIEKRLQALAQGIFCLSALSSVVWGPLLSPFSWDLFLLFFCAERNFLHVPLSFYFCQHRMAFWKKVIVNRRYRMEGSYLNKYLWICSWGNMEIAQLLCRDDDENWWWSFLSTSQSGRNGFFTIFKISVFVCIFQQYFSVFFNISSIFQYFQICREKKSIFKWRQSLIIFPLYIALWG